MGRTGPWGRFAAAGLAAVVALAVPATAMAAGMASSANAEGPTIPPTNPINLVVVPFVDCITANSDGSTTAFFGYYSFARSSTTISKGTKNQITPATLDGPEPSTFTSGYVPRAFSVKIPKATSATWTLSGFPAAAPNAGSPKCSSGDLNVVGFVNCTTLNTDGSTTALFGYYNSVPSTVKIAKGAQNIITPSSYDGPEPVSFTPGIQLGVFSLKVLKGATATWTVNGFPAAAPNTWSPACPPPVSLPQEGNGLGLVMGLIAGGVAGTILIRRMIARATAAT